VVYLQYEYGWRAWGDIRFACCTQSGWVGLGWGSASDIGVEAAAVVAVVVVVVGGAAASTGTGILYMYMYMHMHTRVHTAPVREASYPAGLCLCLDSLVD